MSIPLLAASLAVVTVTRFSSSTPLVGSSALVNNQIDLESPGLLGFEGCLFTQLFCRGSNGWGVWGMEVEEVVGGGVFVSHQATSRGGGGGVE